MIPSYEPPKIKTAMVISTASFVRGLINSTIVFDLKEVRGSLHNSRPLKVLFENLPSDQAADKTTDKSSNKQYRQNPVGHISHERVGIF